MDHLAFLYVGPTFSRLAPSYYVLTSGPIGRLPLFTWEWTAFVHSMLLALLFPLVLHTLREHGLNRTGQYGLLTLYALPKVYAFCAGRALKHVDAMLHIFDASVRVLEAILEHCVEGARFARLQFQNSIVSSERFAEEHFPTQAVHARAIQMQLMYPESSAVSPTSCQYIPLRVRLLYST